MPTTFKNNHSHTGHRQDINAKSPTTMPLLCSSKSGPTIIISHQRRSKMMYQRSSLLPLALCATVVSTASASAVAGGGHAPSDPLAAMAAYARFAHDVISLPAAAAKAQQKNQRNLQFTDGRWTQMASMCGAVGELDWPLSCADCWYGCAYIALDALEMSSFSINPEKNF